MIKSTGELQELRGYPIDLLVKQLPVGVTQFTALFIEDDFTTYEWVISYIKPVPINTPEHTPILA
jgi:hypothetical protein